MSLLLKFLVLAVARLAAEAFEVDAAYRTRGMAHKHLFPRSSTHPLPDWDQADAPAAGEGAAR